MHNKEHGLGLPTLARSPPPKSAQSLVFIRSPHGTFYPLPDPPIPDAPSSSHRPAAMRAGSRRVRSGTPLRPPPPEPLSFPYKPSPSPPHTMCYLRLPRAPGGVHDHSPTDIALYVGVRPTDEQPGNGSYPHIRPREGRLRDDMRKGGVRFQRGGE